jgi:hypothetical protein
MPMLGFIVFLVSQTTNININKSMTLQEVTQICYGTMPEAVTTQTETNQQIQDIADRLIKACEESQRICKQILEAL